MQMVKLSTPSPQEKAIIWMIIWLVAFQEVPDNFYSEDTSFSLTQLSAIQDPA